MLDKRSIDLHVIEYIFLVLVGTVWRLGWWLVVVDHNLISFFNFIQIFDSWILFYAHLNSLVGSHEKLMGAIGGEIRFIFITVVVRAVITMQAFNSQILQFDIHHIDDIVIGLYSLSGVQTLNCGWLMDFQVILVFLVELKHQVYVVVIVGHVGKHLENLLKRRLWGWVFTNSEFFFLVLQKTEEEPNWLVVSEDAEFERTVVVTQDLTSAKLYGQLFYDKKNVFYDMQPLNKVKNADKTLTIAFGFAKKLITETSCRYFIEEPLWKGFIV